MSRVTNYAFIHGKMHGLYAKSRFDERLVSLTKLTSLTELRKELFPGDDSAVPDRFLINDIQNEFERRNLALLLRLLSFFRSPHPLLLHVVREYEYLNLKTLIRKKDSLSSSIELWDLGKFKTLPATMENFPAYLSKTKFKGLVNMLPGTAPFEIELYLDEDYNKTIASLVKKLPMGERRILEPLFRKELLLQNLLWALRLRWYYGYSEEQTHKLLFAFSYTDIEKLVGQFFKFSLDNPDQWQNWKYAWVLGNSKGGKINPLEAENRILKYLTRRYTHAFHNFPFTLASIYAFFRLKTIETRYLKTVSEGIYMTIPQAEIAELLGVEDAC